MTITVYGIPNCDTVKRARNWLAAQGVDHTFHNYKTAGVDAARLERWCSNAGWEIVLNRSGTTFRKLPEADRINLDEDKAIALMATSPSCIKRPVVEHPGGLLVGFKPDVWEQVLA